MRMTVAGITLCLLGAVTLTTVEVLDEIAAPSASAASTAKLYADSTSHTLKLSLNTGSFFDVLTSDSYTACALYTNASATVTVTTAGTYYPWTTTTAGVQHGNCSVSSNTIVVSKTATYEVFNAGSVQRPASAIVDSSVFVNGSEAVQCHWDSQQSGTGRNDHGGAPCLLSLTANDALDLRYTSNTNGDVLTVRHAQLVKIAH